MATAMSTFPASSSSLVSVQGSSGRGHGRASVVSRASFSGLSAAGRAIFLEPSSCSARFISVLSVASRRSVRRTAILALDPDFYKIPITEGVPVGKRLKIWNLPPNVDRNEFLEWFAEEDLPVENLEFTDDPELNAQGIGGFIEFVTKQDACMAIVKRDGYKFKGRCIRMDFVEKRPHDPEIGGRRNRPSYRSRMGSRNYGAVPNPNYNAVPNPNYKAVPNPNYGAVQNPNYAAVPNPNYGSSTSGYATAPNPSYGSAVSSPGYSTGTTSSSSVADSNPSTSPSTPSVPSFGSSSSGYATVPNPSYGSVMTPPSYSTGSSSSGSGADSNPSTSPSTPSVPSFGSNVTPSYQSAPSYSSGSLSQSYGTSSQSTTISGGNAATSFGDSMPSAQTYEPPPSYTSSQPVSTFDSDKSSASYGSTQSVPSSESTQYVEGYTSFGGGQSASGYNTNQGYGSGSVGPNHDIDVLSLYEKSGNSGYGNSTSPSSYNTSSYGRRESSSNHDSSSYGNSTNLSGYGEPEPRSSYASFNTSSGYGGADARSNYGNSNATSGYGAADTRSNYGSSNITSGYGAADTRSGYGNPNPSYGYGGSETRSSYSSPSYGSPRSASPHRIFVGNLPWSTEDSSLQELFSRYGTVSEARVVKDRDTGRSRGFGFVSMSSAEEMEAAIDALNGHEFSGRPLKVNVASSRF